jgi:hypothetical protein
MQQFFLERITMMEVDRGPKRDHRSISPRKRRDTKSTPRKDLSGEAGAQDDIDDHPMFPQNGTELFPAEASSPQGASANQK